jgi:hypothetical protein
MISEDDGQGTDFDPPSRINETASLPWLLDLRPILARIDSGETISRIIGYSWLAGVWMYAVLAVIGWIFVWFVIVSDIIKGDLFVAIGKGVSQIFILVAIFYSTQILFLRSREVARWAEGRFVVVPIVARLISAVSEAMAASAFILAPAGMLHSWFSWGSERPIFQSAIGCFIGGIGALLMNWVFAFNILLLGRLISESLHAMFSIANNVDRIAARNVGTGG